MGSCYSLLPVRHSLEESKTKAHKRKEETAKEEEEEDDDEEKKEEKEEEEEESITNSRFLVLHDYRRCV
jgi:hypothetical protein